MADSTIKAVRRNGQLMSCEPCRRSKQRCDHGRPRCARCERRGQGRQCYYHPAPMTQRKKSASLGQEALQTQSAVNGRSSDSRRDSEANADTAGYTIASSSSAFPPGSFLSPQQGELDRGTGLVSMNNFVPVEGDSSQFPRKYLSLTRNGVALSPLPFVATPIMLAEGMRVLDFVLASPPVVETLASRKYSEEFNETPTGGPIVAAAWRAAQSTLVPDLRANRSDLQSVSRRIFERTSHPQRWPTSAADGALQRALSDGGVRWETVGLYCSISGPCTLKCTPASLSGTPTDLSSLRSRFGHCCGQGCRDHPPWSGELGSRSPYCDPQGFRSMLRMQKHV